MIQRGRFWGRPEPICTLKLVLILTLNVGVNDAFETNVFLSSVNARANTDVQWEWAQKRSHSVLQMVVRPKMNQGCHVLYSKP